MSPAYLCPVCRANRTRFEVIFKLAQEIRKDEARGTTVYQADELTTLVREDGRPDLDVRCGSCGYTGSETSFIRAARRDEEAFMRT